MRTSSFQHRTAEAIASNDILLNIGTAGSLSILNQTVADVGIDDFQHVGLPFRG